MPNSSVFNELMLCALYCMISKNAKPFWKKEFEFVFDLYVKVVKMYIFDGLLLFIT